MYIITPTDYFLFPLYLLVFYLFARKIAKKQETPALRKYLMIAFALRMFGCFAYSMIMQYYYGYGDSFTYFGGGTFYLTEILRQISNIKYLFSPVSVANEWYEATAADPLYIGYFATAANNMVMKISAVFGFLTFNKFLITSLFFGYFSFVGQWKLFRVFDDINKHANQKLLAFTVLFTPSIWFWGSGLLKEAICFGALGIILNFLYFAVTKKQWSVFKLIYCLFLFYLILVIKSYIAVITLMGIAAILIWLFMNAVKLFIFKAAIFILVISGVYLFANSENVAGMIEDYTLESVATIQSYQHSYKVTSEDIGKGGFDIGELSTSTSGLILKSPAVVFSCLFRPFLWEIKNIMMLFTSLESTLLLLVVLYLLIRTAIIGFFKIIFSNPYLLFCFTISILFALIIGFTTFNFGTMIRYKIIFLPFFYFLLVNIYTRLESEKKASKKTI
ncbi:MAG: hypothetical protein ABIW38_14595 [Ferruginibacter sp.]